MKHFPKTNFIKMNTPHKKCYILQQNQGNWKYQNNLLNIAVVLIRLTIDAIIVRATFYRQTDKHLLFHTSYNLRFLSSCFHCRIVMNEYNLLGNDVFQINR